MQLALREAHKGILKGNGGPFGAVIVKGRKVVALGHNQVLKTNNPTRHAEVCAISTASKKLGTPHLTGCEIYSTTEPCPMCFSAIHWARIDKVYYGTSIQDVARLGFNELSISNFTMKKLGKSPIAISNGILNKECIELLKCWKTLPHSRTY